MQPTTFRRPTHPSSAATPAAAFDPDCFDFAAYIGRRFGVDRTLGLEVLGQWLRTYEPANSGDTIFAEPTPAPAPPHESGVYAAVLVPVRTGTDG